MTNTLAAAIATRGEARANHEQAVAALQRARAKAAISQAEADRLNGA
jgi:hypothetical protein